MRLSFASIAALALAALAPAQALAQSQFHPRWEIRGLDFRSAGAWRVRASQVAALRRQLLAQGRLSTLNAPRLLAGPAPSPASITGTMTVPVVLFSYLGIDSTQFMRDTAQYTSVLFGAAPPGGNPYTLRTFYEQLSNNVFSMLGKMIGWVRLDSAEVTYTGVPGTCSGNPFGTTNCNGLFSSNAVSRMQNGFRQALSRVDAAINFAQFDNDGPDLVPNSGDDDGFVDLIMFAHPTRDGACGGSSNNHIWSHRFVLANSNQTTLQPYVTNDASAEGGTVRIADYFVTTALGGTSACDTTQIMPIGTAAHEFGHALGLPDLYDTQGSTEGIGQWGLMGSGNFTSPKSPSRMEAWSLNEMGWVTIAPLTLTGTYSFGAAPVVDSVFLVRAQGTNPRGEYLLLENRQAALADTALIRIHCAKSGNPAGCAGGMLIWHADSMQLVNGGFQTSNTVNFGPIHGLAIEEADGLRQLWCEVGCNRGDAGDPYPGYPSANTAYSFGTTPAARKNSDGSFIGFAIDSIRQVVPGGTMAFRLRFGGLTVVKGSDTNAVVTVDGNNVNVFRNLFEEGSSHTISVADTQLSGDTRTRWRFASWSDAGTRSHTITGTLAGATLTATLNRDFKLVASTPGNGTIASSPVVNLAGELIAQGTPIQLTATPDSGFFFGGWSGDTSTNNAVLQLSMTRPYTVTALFATALAISSGGTRPGGVMGAFYRDTLRATGGTGTYAWTVTGTPLPSGMALDASTGIITGFLQQTGTISYQVQVASGAQTQTKSFSFSVTAPTLVTADVVNHLLGPTQPLTADQLRYLDFQGNNNNGFDVGDFLAWVKATGAPLATKMKGGRP